MFYLFHQEASPDPLTDSDIIQRFICYRLTVRQFVQQGLEEKWLTQSQALRLRTQLYAVAKARQSQKPVSFHLEKYICDSCELPHRMVYKHSEAHQCPICEGGLEISENGSHACMMVAPFMSIFFSGPTINLMGTIIHTLNVEDAATQKPVEYTEEELSKMKVVYYDHTCS